MPALHFSFFWVFLGVCLRIFSFKNSSFQLEFSACHEYSWVIGLAKLLLITSAIFFLSIYTPTEPFTAQTFFKTVNCTMFYFEIIGCYWTSSNQILSGCPRIFFKFNFKGSQMMDKHVILSNLGQDCKSVKVLSCASLQMLVDVCEHHDNSWQRCW